MGKSYRRHNKHPKRKNTRRRGRGGGADGDASSSSSWSSMLSPSMIDTLNTHYQKGLELGQPHVDSMKKMAGDLHNQAKDTEKKAYTTTSKAVRPHYDNMKSSMKSMGSPMGFSSLSTKKPDIKELEHAQQQAKMGTPMQNDPYNQRQMYLP